MEDPIQFEQWRFQADVDIVDAKTGEVVFPQAPRSFRVMPTR
jgi:hypothetical protein